MDVSYSTDGEMYRRLGEFRSHEAAWLILLREEPNLKVGDTVYFGEGRKCRTEEFVPSFEDDILEYMAVRAQDEVGDCAEGWPDCLPHNKRTEIESRFTEFVCSLINELEDEPRFFRVENIKEYKVGENFTMIGGSPLMVKGG